MVFRAEYIKPLPDWFLKIYNADYGLQLILANKGKIGYLNKVMNVYRRAQGSLSYNPKITVEYVNKRIIELMNFIDKHTNLKYEKLIERRIKDLKKQIIMYKIRKKSIIVFGLIHPLNTLGLVLRKIGQKLIDTTSGKQ